GHRSPLERRPDPSGHGVLEPASDPGRSRGVERVPRRGDGRTASRGRGSPGGVGARRSVRPAPVPRRGGPICRGIAVVFRYNPAPARHPRRFPMKTYSAKPGDITREWYVVDAQGKTLGRLATQIADTLRGKRKPQYTPHIDTGDFVVV